MHCPHHHHLSTLSPCSVSLFRGKFDRLYAMIYETISMLFVYCFTLRAKYAASQNLCQSKKKVVCFGIKSDNKQKELCARSYLFCICIYFGDEVFNKLFCSSAIRTFCFNKISLLLLLLFSCENLFTLVLLMLIFIVLDVVSASNNLF